MRFRLSFVVPALLGLIAGGSLIVAPPAVAVVTCPPNPAPGSTVYSNIDVTGSCLFNNVTVYGNVTVETGAGLELESARVYGNIDVRPGGELDIDHTLSSNSATPNTSRVAGTITVTDGVDIDIFNATVGGGLLVNRITQLPKVCNSSFGGNVLITGMPTGTSFTLGNPASTSQACAGNRIYGGVTVTGNAGRIVVDSNTVSGSVSATGNTGSGEVKNNTIGGGLTVCNNTPAYTVSGNTVSGVTKVQPVC
jgi:hypothetical protein